MYHGHRRTAHPRTALAAIGVAAALSVAGCTGQAASLGGAAPSGAATTASASPAPAASASPTPSPSPSAVRVSPHPSPSRVKPTANPGYDKALVQWKDGATAISAQQGAYWLAAASDLQAGKATDGRDTSTYQNAIDELKELTSLPDAQQTPAQNAAYHKDIDGLNSFFGTPGLYS